MARETSLVALGTPAARYLDLNCYLPFDEVVLEHLGSVDLVEVVAHIDGVGARNLTSDPDISRQVLRFVGDYTDPDRIRIHEDDVNEFVRRYKKHQRQAD